MSEYILGISTSCGKGSVAISCDSRLLFESETYFNREFSSRLLPMIDHSINQAGLTKKEIKYIAVDIGPGSFTGIRIGVATALGLVRGLGLKVAGYTSLELILNSFEELKERVVPIIQAGKNEFYIMYKNEIKIMKEDSVITNLKEDRPLTGILWDDSVIKKRFQYIECYPEARICCLLCSRADKNGLKSFIKPLYLKKSYVD
ncbi:MAG: tRNA (adenosine(37)-N6)-threonylcarbamoyltransferase complex dimerization subunit type 1 TsaB [Candidatus Hydrogenedentota bacterium]